MNSECITRLLAYLSENGCAYDSKYNALKVFIPRLVEAVGVVLVHAQAISLRHDRRRVNEARRSPSTQQLISPWAES